MTFTAAGGQTAGPTDFGCTPLEQALKGQLKSGKSKMACAYEPCHTPQMDKNINNKKS